MAFLSQPSATALPTFPFHSAVLAVYADGDATATDIQDLQEYFLPAGVTDGIIKASVPDDDDDDDGGDNGGGGDEGDDGNAGAGGAGAGDGDDDGDDDDDDGALNNLPDFPDDGIPDGGDDGAGDGGDDGAGDDAGDDD